MTEVPNVPPYSGDMPNRAEQDRDTFADNIFLYIKWAGTTFLTNFNIVVEKINIVNSEITTAAEEVQENRDYVSNAKATIEATMGATYSGTWNSVDDFTNKTVINNGSIWVGLSSDIGNIPDYNSNWLFVNYVENKVYKNANYTANVGDIIYVDTSIAKVTITLPTAVKGARIRIYDQEWTFDIFSCDVIDINGILINKIDDGTVYEIDTRGASRTLEVIENKNNILEWRVV